MWFIPISYLYIIYIRYINIFLFFEYKQYQRGRRSEELWVFGVVTTEFVPCKGYYQVVERKNRDNLIPILDKCLKARSEVHTDDWGAYNNLQQQLPQKVAVHRIVNHSINFVDPGTGVHTQNIESKWNSLKQGIK